MTLQYTKALLSTSFGGRNLQISGTVSPGRTIHTVPSSSVSDEIYLYASNNTTSSISLNVLWGDTNSSSLNSFFLLPAMGRTMLTDGKLLSSGNINAWVSNGSVNVDGFVNRITDTAIDPFVSGWVQRVVNNGGPVPSLNTQTALTTFYNGMINTGLFGKMVCVNCIVPDSLTASLVPFIKGGGYDIWVNNNFTSSDLTVNGLKGDGSVRYVDTGILAPGAYSNNLSAGITLYNTFPDTAIATDIGVQSNLDVEEFGLYFNEGNTAFVSIWNEGAGLGQTTMPSSVGYLSANRVSASDMRFYYANATSSHAQIGSTVTTTGGTRLTLTTPMYCWVQSSPGPAPIGTKSKKRFSFVAVHLGLTASESSTFFNLIQQLRINLGGGYV